MRGTKGSLLSGLILAAACVAVISTATSDSVNTLLVQGLEPYKFVEVWTNGFYYRTSLAVEESATAAAEGIMYLKVEGKHDISATLAPDPSLGQNAARLSVTRPEPSRCVPRPDGWPNFGSTNAANSFGNIAWGVLFPVALALAASRSLRHSPLVWLSVVLGLAVYSSSASSQGCDNLPNIRANDGLDDECNVKITLMIQPRQYAVVRQSAFRRGAHGCRKRFDFRHAVCDISSAADSLSGAIQDCAFTHQDSSVLCANVPQPTNCDSEAWCVYPAPPASCSINTTFAQTCMNPFFHTRLTAASLPSLDAAAFVDAIFQCVYSVTTTTTTEECCDGRPYSTVHGPLLAPVNSGVENDGWCSVESLVRVGMGKGALPSGWDEEVAAEVAREWSRQGQEEHASVASFARFSLELLRFAAPPQLLDATHRAAADEVKHAQHSFALASLFNTSSGAVGEDVSSVKRSVGAFPLEIVHLSPDMAAMAARTYEEGCKGESTAVARLAYAVAVMRNDSPARMPAEELLEDEARHAALAWATVRWALKSGQTEIRQSLVKVLAHGDRSMQPDVPALDRQGSPVSLVWGGRIPEEQSQAIRQTAEREWVLRWMEASINDARRPLPAVSSGDVPYGDIVAKAAEIVRQQVSRLEGRISAETFNT